MHKIQTISIGRLFLTTQNDQTALFYIKKKILRIKIVTKLISSYCHLMLRRELQLTSSYIREEEGRHELPSAIVYQIIRMLKSMLQMSE
jgi:hypothetical protein